MTESARPTPSPARGLAARTAAALLALAVLASAGALAPGPALAQDANALLCSQPVEPTCVGSEITYENEQRINRCRRDVQRYADQVDEYTSCLEKKAKRQREEMKALDETFECRAEGGTDC